MTKFTYRRANLGAWIIQIHDDHSGLMTRMLWSVQEANFPALSEPQERAIVASIAQCMQAAFYAGVRAAQTDPEMPQAPLVDIARRVAGTAPRAELDAQFWERQREYEAQETAAGYGPVFEVPPPGVFAPPDRQSSRDVPTTVFTLPPRTRQ